jgi:hypothetical protein
VLTIARSSVVGEPEPLAPLARKEREQADDRDRQEQRYRLDARSDSGQVAQESEEGIDRKRPRERSDELTR